MHGLIIFIIYLTEKHKHAIKMFAIIFQNNATMLPKPFSKLLRKPKKNTI
jgi:hypothetical protein